jgi:glycosyltransferase involved in cell wall biosynthesis
MNQVPNEVAAGPRPLVSVIVPSYNAARYIDGAVACVLAQTYPHLELIVVDDGSTDDTAQLVRSVTDPRVRLVQQANRGLAGARNAGIRAARGSLLAFLDADDRWRADKLSRHVQHLTACAEVGVSYSASALIDDDEQPLGLTQRPKTRNVSARDVFLRNPVGNGSAPVIRRRLFDEIGFANPLMPDEVWYFDESLRQSEDIECWMRIALSTTWRFEGLPEPLTLYRINGSGLSAHLDRQLATWEGMVERAARLDAAFVAHHVAAARGYQLRYLARRAVQLQDGRRALGLLWRALRSHPGMWREEPARTAVTLAAALLCACAPAPLYRWLESATRSIAGRLQQTAVS